MRLDVYLVDNGFAPSRQKAVYLISQGRVTVDGKTVTKCSTDVEQKTVCVTGEGLRFVSRGGLKLEGALRAFRFDPAGLVCLDLGASTGGFTDCLLQNGAAKVYALDVGHGQLDKRLLCDKRVIPMEGFNARSLCEDSLPDKVDLAVSDLSFISQRLIYAPLSRVLKPGASFISLIKPQFEVGRAYVGKNGIVKDREAHGRAIRELIAAAAQSELYIGALDVSPIRGGDGNTEYLALFGYNTPFDFDPRRIDEITAG